MKSTINNILNTSYYIENKDPLSIEIGIDEAGRGPMFGRVYAAAVVLPKDKDLFDHSLMKDSKKFTSKKKINEVYDYIKKNAIAYNVSYEDETTIDKINILQALGYAGDLTIDGKRKNITLIRDDNGILQLNNSGGSNAGNEVLILGTHAGGKGQIASGIGFKRNNSSDWGTSLTFRTHSAATSNIDELNEVMRIHHTGQVTINSLNLLAFKNVSTPNPISQNLVGRRK